MRSKERSGSRSVAKGYRLKPETHRLIKRLQKEIKGTKEETLSRACNLLQDSIRELNFNKKNNKQ
ncbi:MAG TPA: hypothetical protein VGK25_10805 [Ignavibacteria bacterium]